MSYPNTTPAGMPLGSAPTQGGQDGLHPTVSYGQPGGQQAQVLPQNAPMPPANQQPQQQPQIGFPPMPPAPQQNQQQGTFPGQAQYQPPNQPSYSIPQQPQQQFQQVQHPNQQQPAHQVPSGVDPNTRLDGPNVPPELRGRTMGQVFQIYGALANDWLQRNPNAAPRQAPQAPQAPQQPNHQPAHQPARPSAQPSAAPDDAQFWQNPMQAIRTAVAEVAAPIMQRTQAAQIQEARQIAAMGIPDFGALEPAIMEVISGADSQSLGNPQFWINAADLARGRVARGGMQGQMTQQPSGFVPPQNNPHNQQFMRGPGGAVPANMSPMPAYQFFTEGPTAPGLNQMIPMTPEQREVAHKMGMSEQDYMNWGGGIQRRGY